MILCTPVSLPKPTNRLVCSSHLLFTKLLGDLKHIHQKCVFPPVCVQRTALNHPITEFPATDVGFTLLDMNSRTIPDGARNLREVLALGIPHKHHNRIFFIETFQPNKGGAGKMTSANSSVYSDDEWRHSAGTWTAGLCFAGAWTATTCPAKKLLLVRNISVTQVQIGESYCRL